MIFCYFASSKHALNIHFLQALTYQTDKIPNTAQSLHFYRVGQVCKTTYRYINTEQKLHVKISLEIKSEKSFAKQHHFDNRQRTDRK